MIRAQEVAAIRRLYEDWKTPWEAGDAAGVADFYTDDAIQIPANGPDIIGTSTSSNASRMGPGRSTVPSESMISRPSRH